MQRQQIQAVPMLQLVPDSGPKAGAEITERDLPMVPGNRVLSAPHGALASRQHPLPVAPWVQERLCDFLPMRTDLSVVL